MEKAERLLDIAKNNFKEHFSYFPLDLQGNEIHELFTVNAFSNELKYHEDIDCISLGWHKRYIYVKGKWSDIIFNYFNDNTFERFTVSESTFLENIFAIAILRNLTHIT